MSPPLPPRIGPASRPSPAIRRRGGRRRTSVAVSPCDDRLQVFRRYDQSGRRLPGAASQQRQEIRVQRRLAVCVERSERLVHRPVERPEDRKSTRLNSSHLVISYAVFCLKKKKTT